MFACRLAVEGSARPRADADVSRLLLRVLQSLQGSGEWERANLDPSHILLVGPTQDIVFLDAGASDHAGCAVLPPERVLRDDFPVASCPLAGQDPATLVWGVGCLAFELLTGRPPFSGDAPRFLASPAAEAGAAPHAQASPPTPARGLRSFSLCRSVLWDDAGPSTPDPCLGELVRRCLAKDAAARPSPSELLTHAALSGTAHPSPAGAAVASLLAGSHNSRSRGVIRRAGEAASTSGTRPDGAHKAKSPGPAALRSATPPGRGQRPPTPEPSAPRSAVEVGYPSPSSGTRRGVLRATSPVESPRFASSPSACSGPQSPAPPSSDPAPSQEAQSQMTARRRRPAFTPVVAAGRSHSRSSDGCGSGPKPAPQHAGGASAAVTYDQCGARGSAYEAMLQEAREEAAAERRRLADRRRREREPSAEWREALPVGTMAPGYRHQPAMGASAASGPQRPSDNSDDTPRQHADAGRLTPSQGRPGEDVVDTRSPALRSWDSPAPGASVANKRHSGAAAEAEAERFLALRRASLESFRERQALHARHSEYIRRPHSSAAAGPQVAGRREGDGPESEAARQKEASGWGGATSARFESEAQAVARETASMSQAMDLTRRQALAEYREAMQRERDMRQSSTRLW